MEKKAYYKISSLEKGMKILELLALHGELSVTKTAELMETNRAGCHRFIATLRDLGYVEKNDRGRYQPTLKILQLAMKVTSRFEIRNIARPYMQKLSITYHETVNLGYFNGTDIIHIDKIDSHEILRMDSALGDKAPAYCTALGKAILANLPESEQAQYIDNTELSPCAPNTITDRDELSRELTKIRKEGCAVDDEEMAVGLRCIAVPIFDHNSYPAYALSISGPAMRLTHRVVAEMKAHLLDISSELSRSMGNPQ